MVSISSLDTAFSQFYLCSLLQERIRTLIAVKRVTAENAENDGDIWTLLPKDTSPDRAGTDGVRGLTIGQA